MLKSLTHAKLTTKENLVPFILITALFFLWGIAHGLLDVLNKHFQVILQISKARSGLIQFAMYMAYFSMALPAGLFMKQYGYRKGIILDIFDMPVHFGMWINNARNCGESVYDEAWS